MKKLFFYRLPVVPDCRLQGTVYRQRLSEHEVRLCGGRKSGAGHGGLWQGVQSFKVGANLNYRSLNREQVRANTVTIGPEFAYWLLKGRKFSLAGVVFRHDWLPEGKGKERTGVLGAGAGRLSMATRWVSDLNCCSVRRWHCSLNTVLKCCSIPYFATITISVWVAWFIYKLKI